MKLQKVIKRLLGIALGDLRRSLNQEIVRLPEVTVEQIRFLETGYPRSWYPYEKLLDYYGKDVKIVLVDQEPGASYAEAKKAADLARKIRMAQNKSNANNERGYPTRNSIMQ